MEETDSVHKENVPEGERVHAPSSLRGGKKNMQKQVEKRVLSVFFFLNINKISNNEVADNVSNVVVFNAVLDQTAWGDYMHLLVQTVYLSGKVWG